MSRAGRSANKKPGYHFGRRAQEHMMIAVVRRLIKAVKVYISGPSQVCVAETATQCGKDAP